MKPTIHDQLSQRLDEPFLKVQRNMEELRDTLHEINKFMKTNLVNLRADKEKTAHWEQMIFMVEVQHLALFGTVLANFKNYINEFGHDFTFRFDLRNLYNTVEMEREIIRKSLLQKKMSGIKEQLKKSLQPSKSTKTGETARKAPTREKKVASIIKKERMVEGQALPVTALKEIEKGLPPQVEEEEKPFCFGVLCNQRMLCGTCPRDIFEACFTLYKETEEEKKKPKLPTRTLPRKEI